ncbi:MAG: hypothetical protein BWY76_01025 [bacterium ADurb.Bin429]|nr:MAG: hypothetical protein BWY76_01025 [bacterium ADurb.Bin429]
MTPASPLTLGFTPDDALFDHLADEVRRRRFDPAIAKSVIRQLLYTLNDDFVRRTLFDHLAETSAHDIYTACYVSYRPRKCRCANAERLYFQVTFYTRNLTNFTVIHLELADESLLQYMPACPFLPTPEERRQTRR